MALPGVPEPERLGADGVPLHVRCGAEPGVAARRGGGAHVRPGLRAAPPLPAPLHAAVPSWPLPALPGYR